MLPTETNQRTWEQLDVLGDLRSQDKGRTLSEATSRERVLEDISRGLIRDLGGSQRGENVATAQGPCMEVTQQTLEEGNKPKIPGVGLCRETRVEPEGAVSPYASGLVVGASPGAVNLYL